MEATLPRGTSFGVEMKKEETDYAPCVLQNTTTVGNYNMAQVPPTAYSSTNNYSVPSPAQGRTQFMGSVKKTEGQEFPQPDYRFENLAINSTKQIQSTIAPTSTTREAYTLCLYDERGETNQPYNPSCSYDDALGNRNMAQAPSATYSLAINHSTHNGAQGSTQIASSVNMPAPQVMPPVNRFSEGATSSTRQMQAGMNVQNTFIGCGTSNQLQHPSYSYSSAVENRITTHQGPSATYSLTMSHSLNMPAPSQAVLCPDFMTKPSGTIQSSGTHPKNMPDGCHESNQLPNPQDSYNCGFGDRDVTQAPSATHSLEINHSNPNVAQCNKQMFPPSSDNPVQNLTDPNRQVLCAIQPTDTIGTPSWLNKSQKKKNGIRYTHIRNREWKELRDRGVTRCLSCEEKLETFCFTCEACSSVFCTLICVKNCDKCSNGSSLCERLRLSEKQRLYQGKANTNVIRGGAGSSESGTLCKPKRRIYLDSREWRDWRSRGAFKCLTCAEKIKKKAFVCCNACNAWYCTNSCMKHHKVC